MTRLSVNLNKVALIRNQRDTARPSVIAAAHTALTAGADGITVHPRPDGRHIRRRDVLDLADFLKREAGPYTEFNIEGNPFERGFPDLVAQVRPAQATLVPDARSAFTSSEGWDIERHQNRLANLIAQFRDYGSRISVFIDPIPSAARQAAEIGADRVELYTGPYAEAFDAGDRVKSLKTYWETVQVARETGLGLNAGHDLNLRNLGRLIAAIPDIDEVSIGHAFTVDALNLGLFEATKAYLTRLRNTNLR